MDWQTAADKARVGLILAEHNPRLDVEFFRTVLVAAGLRGIEPGPDKIILERYTSGKAER